MKADISEWKKILDNILVLNLFIILLGAIFFLASSLLSANGNHIFYNIFQKLWFPVFIPSLSLFFTAVLTEAIVNIFNKNNQ